MRACHKGLWALLVGATLLAYLPLRHAGFIWDDDGMLLDNRLIAAADGLRRIWLSHQAIDYWPVTYTALWLEWRLWGASPLGYHVVNLGLHVGSALLLRWVLRRRGIAGADWAALLFALHPMNVESVAWIAQIKNLLSLCFGLLSLGLWPGNAPRSGGRYAASLGCFLLALLSKGDVIPLPLVFLGLALCEGPLSRRTILRLAPCFLLAAAAAGVTLAWPAAAPSGPIRTAGPVLRLLTAGAIPWFYLSHIVWPRPLLFVYPMWHPRIAAPGWWLPLAGLVLTGAWLARPAGRRDPAARAWAFFLVMLAPVLGLVDVYFMKYSLVADHYAHWAMIGPVTYFVWLWWNRSGPESPRTLAALALVALLLGIQTHAQAAFYRSNLTLFRATLRGNPESWMAHSIVGTELLHSGEPDEAVAEFQAAIRLKPDFAPAHNNLGNVYALRSGRLPEAIAEYRAALRSDPSLLEARINLGNALAHTPGRVPESLPEYEAALRLDPDSLAARYDLGLALRALGRLREADEQFARARQLSARP